MMRVMSIARVSRMAAIVNWFLDAAIVLHDGDEQMCVCILAFWGVVVNMWEVITEVVGCWLLAGLLLQLFRHSLRCRCDYRL
jgi:hypothetical protein